MCVKLRQCLRESYRKKKCLLRNPRLCTLLPRSTLWYCHAVKTTASLSDLALTSSNLKRIFPDPYCVNSIVFACLSLLKWVSFCISDVSSSWEKWLAKYICSEKSGGCIFPRSRKRDNFVLVDHCLDHWLHERAKLSHRHPSGESLSPVYGIVSPERVLWCSPALPLWSCPARCQAPPNLHIGNAESRSQVLESFPRISRWGFESRCLLFLLYLSYPSWVSK